MRDVRVMKWFAGVGLCGFVLLGSIAVAAEDPGPVKTVLAAFKVVANPDGKEEFEEAAAAEPGELIEYRLTLSNAGDQPVLSLQPVLPIPQGVVYQADTAAPATVEATVDGQEFEPVPLMRQRKAPDGTLRMERVPESEYRQLRWKLETLDAGNNIVVKARVRVRR